MYDEVFSYIESYGDAKGVKVYMDFDVVELNHKFLFEYDGLVGRLDISDNEVCSERKEEVIVDVARRAIDELVEFRNENPESNDKDLVFKFYYKGHKVS